MRMFGPLTQPRQFGAAFSGWLLFGLLLHHGEGWTGGLAILLGWALGILIAVNRALLLPGRRGRELAGVSRESWSRVLAGCVLGPAVAYALAATRVSPWEMSAALAVAIALFYGFCKLGCLRYECCGWPGEDAGRGGVRLQALESTFSFAVAGVTAFVLLTGSAVAATLFFLSFHWLQRAASKFVRRPGESPAPRRKSMSYPRTWPLQSMEDG